MRRGALSTVAVVDPEACTGCETCVDACPAAAIAVEDGRAKVDPGICVDCGTCVGECPAGAISLE